MGEIDDNALADLVDEDPDHAMSLLAQMRGATDQKLAALAARDGRRARVAMEDHTRHWQGYFAERFVERESAEDTA